MLTTSGCGFVVDADRFRQVTSPTPGSGVVTLYEGAGGPAGLGRGEPLWLDARGFSDAVTVRSEDPRVILSLPMRSGDGQPLSVLAWAAPFRDLGEGQQRQVTLWLEEGTTTASVTLTVLGLEELELGGLVNSQTLRPLYSDIATMASVRFEGPQLARLVSTGAVRLMHPVSVAALNGRPGAGGFGPGEGPRSGRTAEDVSGGCAGGGGGAGGRNAGQPARGGASGGESSVLSLGLGPLDQTVGSGGGRGGSSGGDMGLVGGAGAGSLFIDGAVVQWQGRLDAGGAPGEDAPGSGCGQDGTGAGGGGSAGLIWVRARQALMGGVTALVSGGAGGSGGQKSGGDGADGWLRIDAPDLDVPSAAGLNGAMYPAYRGPAWDIQDARLAPAADMAFSADPELRLSLHIDDILITEVQADMQGRGLVPAPTAAGLHQVCLRAIAAPEMTKETTICVRIAVLP